MKKILIAINAEEINEHSLNFACYLAQLTHSTLTAVFLENLIANEKLVWKHAAASTYPDWEIDEQSSEFVAKKKRINENIALFRSTCESKHISFKIYDDKSVPVREMEEESRFADLIVVDACMSFKGYTGTPSEFVQQLLRSSECPVIIAPESFNAIDELIFTYDGSKAAAHAIKQFTYLFPELADKRVIVFRITGDGNWNEPDKVKLHDWLQQRYSSIGFEIQKGEVKDKLFDYLFKRENTFIVMGAYSRSGLSRFFKESQADIVINTIPRPLFIAHN